MKFKEIKSKDRLINEQMNERVNQSWRKTYKNQIKSSLENPVWASLGIISFKTAENKVSQTLSKYFLFTVFLNERWRMSFVMFMFVNCEKKFTNPLNILESSSSLTLG